MLFNQVKIILTDIEGTTSSISFVKETLFPYAARELPEFIRQNKMLPAVQTQLTAVNKLAADEGLTLSTDDNEAQIQCLLNWIKTDKKATPLKTLQGMIWQQGYENGDYQAHMYADATHQLQQWHDADVPLYVYSSGSVQAQKLFYRYSQDGDLLPLFSGHFDTTHGAKQELQSYLNILATLQKEHEIEPENILFLSDIEQELDAACEAGLQTCWLIRDSDLPANTNHPAVSSFTQINF